MARYKISLLTSVADGNTSYFLPTVLGIYNDQISYDKKGYTDYSRYLSTAHSNAEQSFCYTYNEKLSIHQNAQKELNFSMDRKILLHDEWMINPHIAALHVGSIIELIDKYDQTYLFIIKKISYTFKENNITYNYTCQDAFSYQYTRQQSGYTIENDASSEDFIGPKTIDWWVIKKIIPECYIEYEYIPLTVGLYKDGSGEIHRFTNEEREKWTSDISKTIIKEPFVDSEYQTTFAFSCSGSNANAALIALGDQLDLMLHTYEQKQMGSKATKYYHYFWYEPKQNQDVTGLKYSPKSQISSFDLSFAGDSLTTVLNVNSHKVGDDLITLIPQTPALFTNYFMTNDWLNSKFKPGYFTSLISGKFYKNLSSTLEQEDNTVDIEVCSEVKNFTAIDSIDTEDSTDTKFIAIKLFDKDSVDKKLKLSVLYNLFSDNWQQTNYTNFTYMINNEQYTFNGNRNHMYLIIKNPKSETNNYYIIHEDCEIPGVLLGKPQEVYLGIRTNATGVISITDINLYLNFYRNFTEEEKEFAEVADQCPWLENRLIDFSYFLQQHIISKQEYETLMDKIQNDLRIVNGKLLFLSNSYFRALQEKTKILTDLTTKLDSLSAAFHADVVSPLQEGSTINNTNSFLNSYNAVFKMQENTTSLLNYTDVLSDYFEKYLSSEQRFLKNVYAFRNYFDSLCSFSSDEDAGIYVDTITTNIPSNETTHFITLGTPVFSNKNLQDHKLSQWFYQENNKYIIPNFVTTINATQYYKPSVQANRLISLSDANNINLYDFSKNASYFLTKEDYNKYFGSIARKQDLIQTYTDTDTGITYYKLDSTELKRLVINEHKSDYYLRNKDTYIDLDSIRSTYNLISDTISWITLPNLLSYWETTKTNKANNIVDWGWDSNKNNGDAFFWNYYTSFLPVDTIYYKGPVIKATSTTKTYNETDYTQWTIQRLNQLNKPDAATSYEKYQPIPFAGNGLILKDWGNCSTDDAIKAKQQLESTWKYVAFNFTPNAGQNLATLATGLGGFLIAPWAPFLGLALACASAVYHSLYSENWYQWKTNIEAYRSFEGKGNTYHCLNAESGTKLIPPTGDKRLETYYNYDSYFANYATSTDASSQHMLQTALFYHIFDNSHKPKRQTYEPDITWYKNYGDWRNTKFNVDDINTKQQYNLYQYFNFYKYIVPTYSFRLGKAKDASLFVKNTYFRVLGADDRINSVDSYLRIPIYEDFENNEFPSSLSEDTERQKTLADHTKMIYIKDPDYFNQANQEQLYSTLRWYPLYQLGTDLNLKSLDIWANQESYTLKELLTLIVKNINSNNSVSSNNSGNLETTITDKIVSFKSKTTNPMCAKYFYIHIENYVRNVFDAENQDTTESNFNGESESIGSVVYAIDGNSNKAISILGNVYSITTDLIVNPLNRPQALKFTDTDIKLYMIADQDDQMVPITNDDIVDNKIETTRCYQLDSELGEFRRIYTQEQILATLTANEDTDYCDLATALKFCYIDNTELQVTNFTPHTKTFTTNLYLCTLTKQDDIYKIVSRPYYGKDTLDFSQQEYDNSNTIQQTFTLTDENGISYQSLIKVTEVEQESLSNISNGTFWYRYHSRIDTPTLAEYAAVIETQLQVYWNQAYTASKYCKYFLPESWQPQTGDTINSFAKNIITVKINTDDTTIDNVTLSNYYLPEVDIYVNDKFETFKYKHYLTNFIWRYNPTNAYTWDKLFTNEEVLQQQDNNYVKADSVPILINNQGILDVMSHLNTQLSDWEVVENGYTVYYYAVGEKSGVLWKELANNINNTSIFEHFDGLYGMMYYLLKQNYTECMIQEYEKAKQQKANIWNQIYTEYPFLMLEDNYSYDLATTSSELLKMAQLVFKGKKQPEKNYNIAIIDTHSLIGYQGQELKPGQGIQINANDYYDENDDIYNALSQYLFITDVNYDLRKDTNVNITVNNIKYQEKLLQSLVKLIR